MQPNETHYSNKDYKRLGDRIRNKPHDIAADDLLMLQQLRMSYKEPLATIFNAIERLAHNVDKDCICTYRVKRIESIVSKLIRFPEMQVNRAEDIAGCRCILSSTEKVYVLYNRILKNQSRLPFLIKGVIHDYIEKPKESGYRSIHLNAVLKDGDNRRVEIQLRALEHHNWATLVEITDLLFGAKLKEYGRQGNEDLFEFHRLLARNEDALTKKDKYKIADVSIKYNYITTIGDVFARNYLDVRAQWNEMKLQQKHFFLISTGSDGTPDFLGYLLFEEAEKAYFERFINNDENRNIVLTHLQRADFTKISIAYSNYFLTFNNTMNRVLLYLSEAVVNAYKQNKVQAFSRYFQSFLDIVTFWVDRQMLELRSFKLDKNVKNSLLMRTEWTNSIKSSINTMHYIMADMRRRIRFDVMHIAPYVVMRKKLHRFRIDVVDKQNGHHEG